jgi:hypothetical protein
MVTDVVVGVVGAVVFVIAAAVVLYCVYKRAPVDAAATADMSPQAHQYDIMPSPVAGGGEQCECILLIASVRLATCRWTDIVE